ncbi:nitroreductase/quinone reductase family protein [Streptomyces sp. NPDC102402]|uniref:nitroreductase/quinone reductase family protein n=1 Tax=Streptomyces sp. NPDC102402 TaxID=3366169 RepID=UPI0037F728CA
MTDQHPSPAAFNQQVIEEFRANGGAVGGMFEGAPLVLLTTTGARTGRPRTNPAVYARDGDRILVFASNAGGPRHPDWYRNLLADPRVTVETGTEGGAVETYAATAEPLLGEERDRLYRAQCERDPAFSAYQAGTTRVIPVIALNRLDLSDREHTRAIGAYLARVHRELREELAVLRRDVDDYLAGPAAAQTGVRPEPSPGKRLAVHCLAFCDALHAHHTGEDGAFTDFEKQFPQLAPAIGRLRAEHHVVAQSLRDIEVILGSLSARTAAGEAETLRAELARLAADLEAHFDHEERQLLPALSGEEPHAS